MFSGILTRLRRMEREDVPQVAAWLGSGSFLHALFGESLAPPHQREQEALRLLQENARDFGRQITLMIETLLQEPPERIGLILYYNVNWRNRTAEWNLFLDRSEQKSSRFGVEAFSLGALYAFRQLNLKKLIGYIYQFNQPSLRIATRAGALTEGKLRQHVYRNSQFHDVFIMSLFRDTLYRLILSHRHSYFRPYFQKGLLEERSLRASLSRRNYL